LNRCHTFIHSVSIQLYINDAGCAADLASWLSVAGLTPLSPPHPPSLSLPLAAVYSIVQPAVGPWVRRRKQLTKHLKLNKNLVYLKFLVKLLVDNYFTKIVCMSLTWFGPTLARPTAPAAATHPAAGNTNRLPDRSEAGYRSSAG